MQAHEIAERLQAKKTATGWQARCPAHEDRNASLSIAEGNDGRTLIKCHAGCTFNSIVAAMDLKPSDFMPLKRERPKRRIIATYDYTDLTGELVFQVVRYEPKHFSQRRPDAKNPGKWLWNMQGVSRVLFRLPEVASAIDGGRIVFIAEGEKDVLALNKLNLVATCNAGGAGKWEPGYSDSLKGARVIILPDRDSPGKQHAALVKDRLEGFADSVQVVELPDRDGRKVKDAADWVAAGGTREELQKIVRNAPKWEPPPSSPEIPTTPAELEPDKPFILLPGGSQGIAKTATELGALLSGTELFFNRGGAIVRLADSDGIQQLSDVRPAALASDFEAVATPCKLDKEGNPTPATCSKAAAELVLSATVFRETLPPLRILSDCPVLIERGGRLVQVTGYDRESGILASGSLAPVIPLEDAKRRLHELLDGFNFATDNDKARALAAIITPALIFGGLLGGRAPVDLGEADASQTGKGYRNKLTAAIYNASPKAITQKKSGVGSLEESFNSALIAGSNFIALDNVRGRIDSPAIESFLTEDNYSARAPYREPVAIDPRRVIVMMTSNKADVTTDLANRCSCTRILKQPAGFTFKRYPEGDILDHVRANRALYLGAVFSIVEAWYSQGKPRTNETRHDFRAWATALDWIVQNLLDAAPLLDGHKETQDRMTNPVLGWLREVALVVVNAEQGWNWLRASDFFELLQETEIEIPGLREDEDPTDSDTHKKAVQAIGRRLGLCFKSGDLVTIDGLKIERQERRDSNSYIVKEYRIIPSANQKSPLAENLDSLAGNVNSETCEAQGNGTKMATGKDLPANGYGFSASQPASHSANETLVSASPANTPQHLYSEVDTNEEPSSNDDYYNMLPTNSGNSGNSGIDDFIEYEEGEL